MLEIGVIADDLTGGNATGALLAAKGLRVASCFNLDDLDQDFSESYDALVVSTDSRLIPKDEAKARVLGVTGKIMRFSPRFYSKRIDSTLRGNLGAEIEGALEALGPQALAVVAPSFPSSGRHAVGGVVIVRGAPLQQTEVSRDPTNPVTTSSYMEVLKQQTALPLGRVDIETVLAGAEAVRLAIDEHYRQGRRIVAADACSDADIACIAQALKGLDCPLVAVDPGPFTAALAEALGTVRKGDQPAVLLVLGSAVELARKQLDVLRATQPCALVKVDCRKLAAQDSRRDEEIADAARRLNLALRDHSILVLCTVAEASDVCSLDELAGLCGLEKHQVSERINSGLSEAAALVLTGNKDRIKGLYTSGGEVTLSVVKRLGAVGFAIRDVVLPLATYGRLIKGDCEGLAIVTKGGLVGDGQSLTQCVNYLRSKASTID
jgi:D-threonate/D-erythronate kinase